MGFAGSLFGGLSPASSGIGSLPLGSLGGFGGIPLAPRAAGGPVVDGVPYLVGEQGPELFIPGSSGSIVTNSTAFGGQKNVTQYFVDARGAAPGVGPEIMAALRATEERAVARSVRTVAESGAGGWRR